MNKKKIKEILKQLKLSGIDHINFHELKDILAQAQEIQKILEPVKDQIKHINEITGTTPFKSIRDIAKEMEKAVSINQEILNFQPSILEQLKELEPALDSIKLLQGSLFINKDAFKQFEGITKDIYEAKLKQYDTELARINDKLESVEETEEDFYVTAGYIVELAKHSSELFKRSEQEERRLLIKTVLSNVTWNGENLSYDYLEPFNLLAEMNESIVWGE